MRNKTFFCLALIALLFYAGCADQNKLAEDGFTDKPDNIIAGTQPGNTVTTTTTATSSSTTTSTSTTETTTTSTTTTTTTSTTTSTAVSVEEGVRVEVIHFYPISPCPNCIKVGQLAEETIYMYYSEEIASGKLIFKKLNYQDPGNKAIVAKYGPASSSLWIGTYINGKFYKEQKISVWYKTSDAEEYHRYLKSFLDKRLEGDLSMGSLA